MSMRKMTRPLFLFSALLTVGLKIPQFLSKPNSFDFDTL